MDAACVLPRHHHSLSASFADFTVPELNSSIAPQSVSFRPRLASKSAGAVGRQ